MNCAQEILALNAAPHWLKRQAYRRAWFDSGLYSGRTMIELMEERVARTPNVSIVFGSHERASESTTSQLLEQSRKVAAGFASLGLREGDVLVAQIPNWKEGALTLLAALRLGLLFVPVVHTCGTAELHFTAGGRKLIMALACVRWIRFPISSTSWLSVNMILPARLISRR
jgi:non-ribosomal peptide synthetase component E (peptide arylation enzyme)